MSAVQDLKDRWLPTQAAIRHARILLDREPNADMAVIPMCQPGKTRGIWETGQEVRTVPGVVFLATRGTANPDIPGYSWARDAACKLARDFLGGQDGTTAFAVVHRDEHIAVFEDIL